MRDCPADFCPVALSPGPIPGDLQDRDLDPDIVPGQPPNPGRLFLSKINLRVILIYLISHLLKKSALNSDG